MFLLLPKISQKGSIALDIAKMGITFGLLGGMNKFGRLGSESFQFRKVPIEKVTCSKEFK